ncbi:hypothetical protein BU26DRAFT_523741 [Trematosphaeria pertusa]|uniref:Secreted protein n=1 Tax=Trematosphaeria pertusa TaxID=390896 RepID=A0A6A6HZD5_9PLEO|nr:uncharacterized protein BU26DRAFT_523741 [Trematosphaeria pertusa]KAF2243431.1 hypothetical protein BU26DRAFT_523741 [Trematosphaeria pertusa]
MWRRFFACGALVLVPLHEASCKEVSSLLELTGLAHAHALGRRHGLDFVGGVGGACDERGCDDGSDFGESSRMHLVADAWWNVMFGFIPTGTVERALRIRERGFFLIWLLQNVEP